MTKRFACIYNQQSGRQATSRADIEAAFKTSDVELMFYDIAQGLAVIEKALQRSRPDLFIAAGGDGTVNATARLAVKLEKPLGVLPVGTLNHFAKDMGLPTDIDEAAQVIMAMQTAATDYCTVNGEVFVNNSSVGIYPATVLGRDDAHPALGKWLATGVAFMTALLRNHTLRLRMETVDQTVSISTPLLFVGNNEYAVERAGFTKRENVSEGRLFIFVVKAAKPLALVRVALLTILGMVRHKSDICMTTAEPVIFYSKRQSVHVAVDGEVLRLDFPLKYEMHHGKLQVCVAKQ